MNTSCLQTYDSTLNFDVSILYNSSYGQRRYKTSQGGHISGHFEIIGYFQGYTLHTLLILK